MRRPGKDYEDKMMASERQPLTPPPSPAPPSPGAPRTPPPPGSGGQGPTTVIDVPTEVPPEGEVLGEGDDVEEALEDAEDAEGEESEQARGTEGA